MSKADDLWRKKASERVSHCVKFAENNPFEPPATHDLPPSPLRSMSEYSRHAIHHTPAARCLSLNFDSCFFVSLFSCHNLLVINHTSHLITPEQKSSLPETDIPQSAVYESRESGSNREPADYDTQQQYHERRLKSSLIVRPRALKLLSGTDFYLVYRRWGFQQRLNPEPLIFCVFRREYGWTLLCSLGRNGSPRNSGGSSWPVTPPMIGG